MPLLGIVLIQIPFLSDIVLTHIFAIKGKQVYNKRMSMMNVLSVWHVFLLNFGSEASVLLVARAVLWASGMANFMLVKLVVQLRSYKLLPYMIRLNQMTLCPVAIVFVSLCSLKSLSLSFNYYYFCLFVNLVFPSSFFIFLIFLS